MKTMEAGRLVWKGLFGGVPELSLEELKAYRAEHHEDSYTLLDVRQPGEYEKEHLPGALLIPLPQLEGRVGELDQAKPVIAYCAIGGRSRAAAEMLSGRGFDEVYSLAGGIEAWKGEVAKGPAQAGLGLLKGDETLAGLLAVVYGLEKGPGRILSGRR
jgi:rhodanese-related sulfurtransferase